MKAFKGFENWIEIFMGGKQIDSNGRPHDGDALIDKAVVSFDAASHEPPAVVGHPKDNAPAYAWVEGVKKATRNGASVLMAKFRNVVPEFEDLVKKGMYKKRSASFYPDGRLRHVGFLGAVPPAVKGLAELRFEEGDEAVTFDFYDPGMGTIAGIFRRLRDWLIEKEGKEAADTIIPDWDVEYIREEANKEATKTEPVPGFSGAQNIIDRGDQAAKEREAEIMSSFKEKFKNFLSSTGVDVSKVPEDALPDSIPAGAGAGAFTEADIEAAKTEAAVKERKKTEAEFAEKELQRQRKAREGEISNWCDTMVKEGNLTPGLVAFGLPEILSFLAESGDTIEFGEAKEKALPYDRLKAIFETELPKLVEFKEIADRKTDPGTGTAADKLDKLVKEKLAGDKELDYSSAFSEVQRENPELAAEYRQELA